MKSLRILLSVAVLSLSAMAFAQADAHKHAAQSDAPKSDAQKAFDKLKTLAGTWSDLYGRFSATRLGQQANMALHACDFQGKPAGA